VTEAPVPAGVLASRENYMGMTIRAP
jgi:hypothetical protein